MRATFAGTLIFRVPAGRSRNALTTSIAASSSPSAGVSRSSRRAPASVGAMLRVVRLISRTFSFASSLRTAVARGVNHIDTSDFYGPHVTNQLIREALHPYPDDLVIVTKVGAVRGADASWIPALTPADLTRAVHDNLRNLELDALDVVNLRVGGIHGPS